jgi:hypothetical protein
MSFASRVAFVPASSLDCSLREADRMAKIGAASDLRWWKAFPGVRSHDSGPKEAALNEPSTAR